MSINLKVIGYLINQDTFDEVESTIGCINNVVLSMHLRGGEWSINSIGDTEIPDIVIYEIVGDNEDDLQGLDAFLKEYADQVVVYVTYKSIEMDTMRRLMKAGVRGVFPQPIERHELVSDVTNTLSDKRALISRSKGGKGGITSFIAAKGGTGSTTLAVNVATVLANTHKAKVLLVDLDIQFGDAALLLDLMPANNVMEALLQPSRIDPVFIQALITRHESSGLDVIASPADLTPMGGISAEGVTNLIEAAAQVYDFVILDVPRILTSWTMAALRYSDPIMMVGQNNLSTIRDTKLLLDKLKHEGISSDKIEVINNRAKAKKASISIDKLKETLGIERMHKATNDHNASVTSQNQGQPLDEVSKRSQFTKDIKALAEHIYILQNGEQKKGLFDKLFS